MPTRRAKVGKYKTGDWVTFPMWPKRRLAQVLAFRGPIGRSGTNIYFIREVTEYGEEPREFEAAESSLEPASSPPSANGLPDVK